MTNLELRIAIRNKCLDCVGQQPKEVRFCPSVSCANWPYRMGKNHPKQNPKHPDLLQIGVFWIELFRRFGISLVRSPSAIL